MIVKIESLIGSLVFVWYIDRCVYFDYENMRKL